MRCSQKRRSGSLKITFDAQQPSVTYGAPRWISTVGGGAISTNTLKCTVPARASPLTRKYQGCQKTRLEKTGVGKSCRCREAVSGSPPKCREVPQNVGKWIQNKDSSSNSCHLEAKHWFLEPNCPNFRLGDFLTQLPDNDTTSRHLNPGRHVVKWLPDTTVSGSRVGSREGCRQHRWQP